MTEFNLSNYQSVNNDIRVDYMKKECSRIFKLMNETIQEQREEFEKFSNETTSLMESMGFIIQKQQKEINELKNKLQEEEIVNTIHKYINKEYIETEIEDTLVKIKNNIDIISNTNINLGSDTLDFPINSKIIEIKRGNNVIMWNKIQYFFQLEELIIDTLNICIFYTVFSNQTLKKISIINSPIFSFEFLQYFPNLEELYFNGIWMNNSDLNNLKRINHKIKKIHLKNVGAFKLIMFDLRTYCKEKNIEFISE